MTALLICARCKRGVHIAVYTLCGPCIEREATIEQWAKCAECERHFWPPNEDTLCSLCGWGGAHERGAAKMRDELAALRTAS